MSRAWEQYSISLGKRVTNRQRCFVMILAIHKQEYRETYWPSHASIAGMMGTDEREIRRVVAELSSLGIVKATPGFGQQRTSYELPEVQETISQGSSQGSGTPVRQGGRQGDFTTRNKVLQDTKSKPIQELGFDVNLQPMRGQIPLVSSSTKTDDDTEEIHSAVRTILKAYEDSPVTTGKSNAADEATARCWLQGTTLRGRVPHMQEEIFVPYTVEQIKDGIILATVRRMGSLIQAEAHPSPVRSLQYFQDAIMERIGDPNISDMYIAHCERGIERLRDRWKKPMGVAAG